MSTLEIGEATPEERLWAGRLMASSEPWVTLGRGEDACRAAALDPDYVTLVARAGGEPLGFARLHPRGAVGSPYLASIAVVPAARSRGVGAALLDAAEKRFAGARWIFLCVSSFNERARSLYERRGYRAAGELPDYVVDGFAEILMVKRLP
ncbi:MAG TPA: GNAT family N-acetyltransferase [Thermoanaerobaculia bacterium]|nr:GNAT family N-acetyltransferase [Thermoanaerobaculia bacterium]